MKINEEDEIRIDKSEAEDKAINYILKLPRGENKVIVTAIDESGNIFISGYNPMILKYLEVGFNAKAFLNKLISEYDLAYKRNYEK